MKQLYSMNEFFSEATVPLTTTTVSSPKGIVFYKSNVINLNDFVKQKNHLENTTKPLKQCAQSKQGI